MIRTAGKLQGTPKSNGRTGEAKEYLRKRHDRADRIYPFQPASSIKFKFVYGNDAHARLHSDRVYRQDIEPSVGFYAAQLREGIRRGDLNAARELVLLKSELEKLHQESVEECPVVLEQARLLHLQRELFSFSPVKQLTRRPREWSSLWADYLYGLMKSMRTDSGTLWIAFDSESPVKKLDTTELLQEVNALPACSPDTVIKWWRVAQKILLAWSDNRPFDLPGLKHYIAKSNSEGDRRTAAINPVKLAFLRILGSKRRSVEFS